MQHASSPPKAGSGKGAFALFAGSIAYAFANFGRLLLWAFPLPLFGFAFSYLLDGPSMLGGMDLLDAAEQSGFDEGPSSAIDDEKFESNGEGMSAEPLAKGLFGLLLAVPVQFSVQRNLLLGSPLVRPAYPMLYTSRLVWRYAALVIMLSFLVWIVLFVHGALLSRFLPEDPAQASFGLVLLSYAFLGTALLVFMKLSPAPALLAKGDPSPLRASWRATRGGLFRLLGLYLLCMLSLAFVSAISVLALGGMAREGFVEPLLIAVEAVSFMWVIVLAAAPALYLKTLEDGGAAFGGAGGASAG